MTEKFTPLESKINKPLTYFLTGILWLSIILIIVVIGAGFDIIFTHFGQFWKEDLGILMGIIFAQLLLILCCIALIMGLTYRKKQKIRKVIIDEKGAAFYNSRNHLINTILYSELQHSQNLSVDIHVYNTQTARYSKTILRAYLRDKTGQMISVSIDFNFEHVIISNPYELYRHFLKGVQQFRPDLKIGQQTIEQYNLTSEQPPVSKWGIFEYFMTAFFLLIVLGVMYAFAVIIKSLV